MDERENVAVRVRRAVPAAPERVFDAWLDTALLAQWMFGPGTREEEIVRLWTEPRVGGRFSFVVRRGGEEIDHVGTYLEIDRPRRLVFTWGVGEEAGDASRVIVEIAAEGAGSALTVVHEMHPDWAEYADRTRAGWTHMLEMLSARFSRAG